jgi:hypothetical protein
MYLWFDALPKEEQQAMATDFDLLALQFSKENAPAVLESAK